MAVIGRPSSESNLGEIEANVPELADYLGEAITQFGIECEGEE